MFIEDSLADATPPVALEFAQDGVLLLQALERRLPDLVVLDLKMPKLGGLEALRRIRTQPEWKHLPVVIFSSGNRPDEIEHCQALGVQEVVQKPVDLDLFSSLVQRIAATVQP